MARPIEPTPILKGKDAENLLSDIDKTIYSEKKEKFLKECTSTFNKTIKG